MGTFHNDKGPLHGITVAVDTNGSKIYVGRCHEEDADQVVLLDVDMHVDGEGGKSKREWLERAAMFGVWKKFDHFVIPRADVTAIVQLSEAMQSPHFAPATSVSAPEPVQTAAVEASSTTLMQETATAVADAPATNTIVALTPSAQVEVLRLIQEDGRPGVGLRLSVKGGGCSGMSYKLEFDLKKEGDFVAQYDGFSSYLDRKSTIYLRGVTLDHQKGLSGKGFVFQNPNATNTCGCGESFSV